MKLVNETNKQNMVMLLIINRLLTNWEVREKKGARCKRAPTIFLMNRDEYMINYSTAHKQFL